MAFISSQFLVLQNHSLFLSSPYPILPRQQLHSSPNSASANSSGVIKSKKLPIIHVERRGFSFSLLGLIISVAGPFFFSEALAAQLVELDRYGDSKQGFTLLVPSSWIKVDKAGATVLFEDSSKKANNIGVVVSPARISSLGEFGDPQFVADKLIQAERRKDGTKEAEVISISERKGDNGVQVYEFEYTVDSTRGGLKRVFSAAFAHSMKLYLLNISYSDSSENPLDVTKREMLLQVMHSFDAVSAS